MAITTPYSLELTADEGAKNAVAGAVATAVAGKMKIYLGTNVSPGRRQQYVGVLKAAYVFFKNQKGSKEDTSVKAIIGDWQTGSSGSFSFEAGITGITVESVALVIDGAFPSNRSHLADETFKQLINVLLEKTKNN